jgi:hypothetical protein
MSSSSSQHLGNQVGKHFHRLALPSTVHMAGILVEWWHKAGRKRMLPCQHRYHMGQVQEEREPAGWESGQGLGASGRGSVARRISGGTLPCTP